MRIKLSISNYRCFPTHPPAEFEIGDGVTALIGENNAGKSAAMRLLHDLRPVFNQVRSPSGLNQLLQAPMGLPNGEEVRDPEEIVFNGGHGPLRVTLESGEAGDPRTGAPPLANRLLLSRTPDGSWRAAWSDAESPFLVDDKAKTYRPDKPGVITGDAAPIMSALTALASAVYIPSTRHVIRGSASTFDVPVGDTLIGKWDELQRGLAKRNNATADIIEEALTSLFRLEELRVTPTLGANGGMQFKIGGAGQFRSDELGAGLAQVFSALFVVATRRPPLVLIDEPELSLHAPLQFRFLSELQRYASLGLVFSTHNLGLAMNAADRVYTVVRQAGRPETGGRPWSTISRFEESTDLAALLGALSYPSYGEPGARHVLLVEGPTDSRAIQVLLHKLGMADHVVCVHMGGNTTIGSTATARAQLAGVKRLCSRVWCLIDSEATREGQLDDQRRAFLAICKELDVPAHATARRATENYISESACKKAFGDSARAPTAYERVTMQDHGWTKRQTWQAVAAMEPSEFGDVGDFLEGIAPAVFLGSKPGSRGRG